MATITLPVWVLSNSNDPLSDDAVFIWSGVNGAASTPPVYGVLPLFSAREAAELQAARLGRKLRPIECTAREQIASVVQDSRRRNATHVIFDPPLERFDEDRLTSLNEIQWRDSNSPSLPRN